MRKINITLIAIIVLSLIAVPSFAFPDIEKSSFISDINEVNALGIMTGDDEGNFNPKESLTRAEFAKIISTIDYNGVEISSGGTTSFTDFDDSHWAFKYVYYAVGRGYMKGYPDGTFRPDESITGYEAVKVLVAFAGYEYQAISLGGYPTGYEYAARSLGILNGISVNLNEYLYRDEMARLINNMLDLPYVEMVGVGENIDYVINHDKTILNEKMSFKRGKGKVLANETAALGINTPTGEGKISIDGIVMDNTVTGAGDYLGYNVTYIYRYDKLDESYRELIYIAPEETKVINITREDFVSYEDGKLTYELEEGISHTVSISQNADYIKNNDNVAYKAGFFDNLKLADITLISSTNSNTYDTVVGKDFEIVVLDVKDGMNEVVRDAYDPSLILDLRNDIDNKVTIIKDGEEISFSDLKQKDILTAMVGNESTTVYVTRDTEKGIISELDDEGNIIINDKKLKRNYYSLENNKITIRKNAVLYLDVFGNVAHVETGATDGEMIAYLIKMKDNTVDLEGQVHAKFFFTDETFATYVFDSDIYVNGTYLSGVTKDKVASRIAVSGVYQQLVKIKLVDGKIKYINTARTIEDLESTNEDGFCLMYERKQRSFLSEPKCYSFEVYVDDSVPFMSVPADAENADEKDFRVLSYKSFNGNFTFAGYTESINDVIPYVCLMVTADGASDAFEGHDPICVIASKSKIITEDGEPATKLHIYKSRYGNSIFEMDILTYDEDELTDGTYTIADLDVGDAVKMLYDKNNNLELFKVYYKADANRWYGTEAESASAINRIYQRTVTDIKGEYVFVEDVNTGENREIYKTSEFKIILVKNQNGSRKVMFGTETDIVPGDVGIVQTISRMPMALIIYK